MKSLHFKKLPKLFLVLTVVILVSSCQKQERQKQECIETAIASFRTEVTEDQIKSCSITLDLIEYEEEFLFVPSSPNCSFVYSPFNCLAVKVCSDNDIYNQELCTKIRSDAIFLENIEL